MSNSVQIQPVRSVRGRVRPPGSKSITNRAIIVAALAEGDSILDGALESEDTRVMIESWHRLGLTLAHDSANAEVRISGCAGTIPATSAELFLANSGTSMRFLTAAVALGHGVYRLDGVARMRERPIEPLLDALRKLGCDAQSELGTGCPPVRIAARGIRGGHVGIAGHESSQFLSALLMAAPYAEHDLHLEVEGELVSEPFVGMTASVMQAFGVSVDQRGRSFVVPARQRYRGRTYSVEPDATAASYFWAAAAIAGGTVTVEGVGANSLQGDVAFVDLLERMGARVERRGEEITVTGGAPLRGIDADMRAISDTALTLGVVAAFADGPTTISNVAHIREQETDRVRALATELNRIGSRVDERADGLTIHPAPLHGAAIETYHDHRVAMSFALAGLRVPGIEITNPSCTEKTYPHFFRDLESVCQR